MLDLRTSVRYGLGASTSSPASSYPRRPKMQEELSVAIKSIRVRFGTQALTRAGELPPPQPWPSGTPIDSLTGIGGLPRGRLTLLTGSGTCGKFTLALLLLAGATHEFAHAVVIDSRDRGESSLSF